MALLLWEDSSENLIEDSEGFIECSECPCPDSSSSENSTSFSQITDCSTLCPSGAPLDWTFDVSGVTNGDCTLCDSYNGSITIRHHSGCEWRRTPFVLTCPSTSSVTTYNWRLVTTATHFELQAGTTLFGWGSYARYGLPFADFNCLGSNDMPLLATPNSQCNNWPASITINPG